MVGQSAPVFIETYKLKFVFYFIALLLYDTDKNKSQEIIIVGKA